MLSHQQVEIKKIISSKPEKVFDAFADVKKRLQWSALQGLKIDYIKSNFTLGGIDIALCGHPNEMNFKTEAYYSYIKQPVSIVFTESIFFKDNLLSISLTSLEFLPHKNACEIKLIIQIADISGEDVKKNYKQGWESVLNNLDDFLKI